MYCFNHCSHWVHADDLWIPLGMVGSEVEDGLTRGAVLGRMEITREVVEKMDRDRLFDLLVFHGLPISQAVAVHLVDDRHYRLSDAARLVGVSTVAMADACKKGRMKLTNGETETKGV